MDQQSEMFLLLHVQVVVYQHCIKTAQSTFSCSKLTIETEQGVKYVQS